MCLRQAGFHSVARMLIGQLRQELGDLTVREQSSVFLGWERTTASIFINGCLWYTQVGCHEGRTTAMLHGRCGHIVGVDSSKKTVDAARAKFPHMRFEVADGADVAALLALSPAEGLYDKVRNACTSGSRQRMVRTVQRY